jgi:hypothetical protein
MGIPVPLCPGALGTIGTSPPPLAGRRRAGIVRGMLANVESLISGREH